MYVIGNLILATATVLDTLLFLLTVVIIASVIVSWVNADPRNQIVHLINRITFPIYRVIRQRIPLLFNGLDLTPIAVLLLITFLDIAVVDTLKIFAHNLINGL